MTDALPEPLVSSDADMRGLPFMPLDVVRLMDSDLFALSTGDEFKAAVAAWCKSWLQIPAGSLPDDDRVLAHLTGAGSRWRKVKAMALRGFVRCSDGRLYHPVVCEKVAEAWQMRLRQRERSAKGNAVRWGEHPPPPKDAQEPSPGDPPPDPKGQGQGQGQKKERSANADPKKEAEHAYAWPIVQGRDGPCPDSVPDEWLGEGYQTHPLVDGYAASEAFGAYWAEGKGQGTTRTERGWRQCWHGWIRREKPGRSTDWINRYGYNRHLHGILVEAKAAAC